MIIAIEIIADAFCIIIYFAYAVLHLALERADPRCVRVGRRVCACALSCK